VGFAATAVSMVIGTVVGMAAGHFEGLTRSALLRFIDFFLVVPSLILAIVLSTVLSRGLTTIILAIGVTSWAATARVVRAQTLTIEARPYIERARALGAGDGRILARHVFPAVLPIVLANTTLTVGAAIIAESTLSFLGLGDATTFSWGSMLKTALDTGAATAGYWWFVLSPGLAIVVVVLCFTLVGRALEAVLNPTLRSL
jgi:peptide/nickel transport system permease protein